MEGNMKDSLINSLNRAQELTDYMRKAQKELDRQIIEGTAGGDLVIVKMTGRHDVKKVHIDESLMNVEEREVLEELVAAAFNDAVRKVEDVSQKKIESLTAEFSLPDLKDIVS